MCWTVTWDKSSTQTFSNLKYVKYPSRFNFLKSPCIHVSGTRMFSHWREINWKMEQSQTKVWIRLMIHIQWGEEQISHLQGGLHIFVFVFHWTVCLPFCSALLSLCFEHPNPFYNSYLAFSTAFLATLSRNLFSTV